MLSDCVAEDILSEKKANAFLAAVEVPTVQGTVFYNDTFGGKQMNIYSSPTLFEQFFKGKAIERILDELDYEEFEKLKAQQKQMKQQQGGIKRGDLNLDGGSECCKNEAEAVLYKRY